MKWVNGVSREWCHSPCVWRNRSFSVVARLAHCRFFTRRLPGQKLSAHRPPVVGPVGSVLRYEPRVWNCNMRVFNHHHYITVWHHSVGMPLVKLYPYARIIFAAILMVKGSYLASKTKSFGVWWKTPEHPLNRAPGEAVGTVQTQGMTTGSLAE